MDDQIKSKEQMLRILDKGMVPIEKITSEYMALKNLRPGVYSTDEMMALSEGLGLADRNEGRGRRQTGQLIWKHRMHSALSTAKRAHWAEPLGNTYWLVEAPQGVPSRGVFVIMGTPSEITVALGSAVEMAAQIEEPVDFVFCDPPWQLGIGLGRDGHPNFDQEGRSRKDLVDGYVEVPKDQSYFEFSLEWIEAVSKILKTEGHLAVVTGPAQAAAVQIAAEASGLHFQNGLIVPKLTGVHPTKHRFATSHMNVTVMRKGPERMAGRTFNIQPEDPIDQRGRPFPKDVFDPVNPHIRKGLLRYPNSLPIEVVDRLTRTYMDKAQDPYGVDLFQGSGTFARVCYLRGYRCWSSDINLGSVQFTMASLLDIQRQQQELLDFKPMDANAQRGQPLLDL